MTLFPMRRETVRPRESPVLRSSAIAVYRPRAGQTGAKVMHVSRGHGRHGINTEIEVPRGAQDTAQI